MRKMKFRVWHATQYTGKYISWRELQAYDVRSFFIPPDGITIEQFTGMRDKNLNDIYEGDILEKYGEVRYMHGSFVAGKIGSLVYVYAISEEVEIIGNIHENPELVP